MSNRSAAKITPAVKAAGGRAVECYAAPRDILTARVYSDEDIAPDITARYPAANTR
jgi:hypothetical protein